MPDPQTQSTDPLPESYLQAWLAGNSGQQATNPPSHSGEVPPALVTQVFHFRSQDVPVSRIAVEEPEQLQDVPGRPHTDDHLEAWLANISATNTPNHPPSFPTSCLVTQTAHLRSDEEDGLHESEHSPADMQENLGLDLQELQWDTRLRLIFHHADGNSAMKLDSHGRQELLVEPKAIIRTPNDPLQVELLGCLQSRSEIKCSLTAKSIQCDFYYLPYSDEVVLKNNGKGTLTIVSRSPGASAHKVKELFAISIQPEQWRISCGNDAVDFKLMPRRYFLQLEEDPAAAAVKRPAHDDARAPSTPSTVPAGASLPHPVAQAHIGERREIPGPVWAGMTLRNKQVVKVTDAVTGLPEYSLRRSSDWFYRRAHGEAFKAILDDRRSKPTAVLVKRITFRTASGSKEEESNVAALAAARFIQEVVAHRRLQHDRIVHLLGWDARLLCLYIELKPSNDLSSLFWCKDNGPDAGYFRGEIDNAACILANISSALAYLGRNNMIHNDIKPANILYSKVDLPATGPYSAAAAGAVLIDFGLTAAADTVCAGGTPWYIAPEFLEGVRDSASDVWALGIVMLYAMRHIMLPEKWRRYPGWFIRDVQSKKPEAIRAMQAWINEVEVQQDKLKAPGLHAMETELRDLVYRMLLPRRQRIKVAELAEATKKWE